MQLCKLIFHIEIFRLFVDRGNKRHILTSLENVQGYKCKVLTFFHRFSYVCEKGSSMPLGLVIHNASSLLFGV